MHVFEGIRMLIMFAIGFVAALAATPLVVKLIKKIGIKKTNVERKTNAPIYQQFHAKKAGVPMMGGIIIWGTVTVLALVFLALKQLGGFGEYFDFVNRQETYLPLAALFFTALVGLADDLMGTLGKGARGGGLSMKQKLLSYVGIAAVGAWWFYFRLGWDTLYVPFFGNVQMGMWYIPFFMFILVATAFSANETDGLDGLAGGTLFFAFAAMAVIAFVMQRYDLAAMNAVLLGAILAFLWNNIYPAKFFMGDTGSMSLGITLGVMAMLTNTALFLPFFASILIFESVTVIIQMTSKKLRGGKKVFLSTPIHHHFEAIGWPESQVTMRFWIVTVVTSAIGLVLFFLARFM